MIFLPRFKKDTLAAGSNYLAGGAQGRPEWALLGEEAKNRYFRNLRSTRNQNLNPTPAQQPSLQEQMSNPANIPAWANLPVGNMTDSQLQDAYNQWQPYRTAQANAQQAQASQGSLSPVGSWNTYQPPKATYASGSPFALPRFNQRGSRRRPRGTFNSYSSSNARSRNQTPFQSFQTPHR